MSPHSNLADFRVGRHSISPARNVAGTHTQTYAIWTWLEIIITYNMVIVPRLALRVGFQVAVSHPMLPGYMGSQGYITHHGG